MRVEAVLGSMYADAEPWRAPKANDAMSVPLWLSQTRMLEPRVFSFVRCSVVCLP